MRDPFRPDHENANDVGISELIWQLHRSAGGPVTGSPSRSEILQKLNRHFASGDSKVATTAEKVVGQIGSVPLEALKDVKTRSEIVPFMAKYAIPTGRLLAISRGITTEWQLKLVDELSKGFFLIHRVCKYPAERSRGLTFIPELDSAVGANMTGLRPVEAAEKKLLWRESIRAKNHIASGMSVGQDLSRHDRIALKVYVLEALEYLNRAEKADYKLDVSQQPLGWYRLFQIKWQARFGRATFKS